MSSNGRMYAVPDLLEASTNFYVSVLDDFTHGTSVNLVNVFQFETLVNQLETSFYSVDIPPLDVFRILLTLCSRLDEINFAINESINGTDASKNAMQTLHYVDTHGTRFELRQRSLNILHVYARLVHEQLSSSTPFLAEKSELISRYMVHSVNDFFPSSMRLDGFRATKRLVEADELESYRRSVELESDNYDSDSLIKQISENSLSPKISRVAQQLAGHSHTIGTSTRLVSPVKSRTPEPERHEKNLLKRIKVFDDWLVGRKVADMGSGKPAGGGYWDLVEMTLEMCERAQLEDISVWERNAFCNLFQCYCLFLRLIMDITNMSSDHTLLKKMLPYTKRNDIEALVRSVLIDRVPISRRRNRLGPLRTLYGRDKHYIEHQMKLGPAIMENPINIEDVKHDALKLMYEHVLVVYYFYSTVYRGSHSVHITDSVITAICDMLLRLSVDAFDAFLWCAVEGIRTECHFVPCHCALAMFQELVQELKIVLCNVISVDDTAFGNVDELSECIGTIECADDDMDAFTRKLAYFVLLATAIVALVIEEQELPDTDTLQKQIEEFNAEVHRHYDMMNELHGESNSDSDSSVPLPQLHVVL